MSLVSIVLFLALLPIAIVTLYVIFAFVLCIWAVIFSILFDSILSLFKRRGK